MEKLLSDFKSPVLDALAVGTPKDLYLCSAESAAAIANQITLSSKHFALFLAMDARGTEAAELVEVARVLAGRSMVYLCAWGADCERVHDVFDQALADREPDPTDTNVVMTTSHEEESLEEALWFFCNCAVPTQAYERTCHDWIIVAVGNKDWENRIRSAVAKDRTKA
jgi:hypothetical protein